MHGAIAFFDQALFPSKEEVRVPCRRGVALRSLGLYEEAGAAYLVALDLNTRQVDAHYNRGISTGIPSEWRRPRAFRRVIDVDSDAQLSSRAPAQLRTLDSKQPKGE